jgi:NADPH:quinone reductase-like Zn-dependent oxidoreductase
MRSDLGGPRQGVLAEQIVLSAKGIVAIPEHLSYQEAATLPCAAVTAWHALIENGRLQPGETVLALGTGGVSIFALQFAKLTGARVIITSSSDDKLERARQLGADETINYRTFPDWSVRVHELTDKLGADHIVEVGGAGTLEKSLESVRYGGQIHHIGVLSGFEGKVNPWWIIAKSAAVRGVYVGSREMFESMNRAIALHELKPVIDQVFPFTEAREAFSMMESGGHFGKIVIEGAN